MIIGPAAAPLAPGVGEKPLPEDLEGACRALEKAFAQIVFQKMREAMVPANGGGASGFARTSAESMLDSQWAELASQGEGLGLWRALYRQRDPEAVKSAEPEPDQWNRGKPLRTDAEQAVQGGEGEPGPRAGRPRSAAVSAAVEAARYGRPDPRFGVAAAGAEDRNR